MPGISRSPVSSRSESSCGWLAAMSAPLRYARILKGLSFLISRRSAISRRIRAIARLSNPQPFHLDAVVEHARAAVGQRGGDRRPRLRRTVAEQAAPPPRAAHLCAAVAPAALARAIRSSMAGVVTPGASRFRFSHSIAICRPTSSQSPRSSAARMATAVSRIRSKQSKMCRSPSMCRLVISQLFVPELRGAPV